MAMRFQLLLVDDAGGCDGNGDGSGESKSDGLECGG